MITSFKLLKAHTCLGLALPKLLSMFKMVGLTPRLLHKHPNIWGQVANRDNVKGTRIVTVPKRNANAALVTSSKVSIEPKSSRSVGRPLSVGLKHKACSQDFSNLAHESFYLPMNNSFQALQNFDENTYEIHENAPTALDEVVTATAVTTSQTSRKRQPDRANNTKNASSVRKKSSIVSKQANNQNQAEVNAPPTNENRDVGLLLQNDMDLPQLATLGDGGTRFQPAPESGQACDSLLPNRTSYSYVREEKIPLYVWNHKENSKDYKACIIQNNGIFGYVPFTDLKIYTGPPVKWDIVPDIIEAHNLVRQSGVPNFLKCRIPVETSLNANIWRSYLKDYWNQQLPDLLQFGFPLDFHRGSIITSSYVNYASAVQFKTHVDAYITWNYHMVPFMALIMNLPSQFTSLPL